MTSPQIRFENGAAYESYMGRWSQLVGNAFLDWLAPPAALRWLDVGCGNGAFTELIVDRCAPAHVEGIDPAPAQLTYARQRFAAPAAVFREMDAMALTYEAASFDVAVMPLVIFFLTDPAKGVSEMARVVRPGGVVAAYAWDQAGGGNPYDLMRTTLRELGAETPQPPSSDASRLDVLAELWTGAGLREVETRAITVERTFESFADYWDIIQGAPSAGRVLGALSSADRESLQARLRERLPADAAGRITYGARANAVKGRPG